MQAIILAAGMGKRLGKKTENNTKGMVEVLGTTLIERAISALLENGITKIIIVVGYKKDNLINFISEKYSTIDITFVENPIYEKTNNIYSLYLAKDYLLESDTILLESDLIFESNIITSLLENDADNVVVVAKYENWMDGTVVTIDESNHVIDFIPKKKFTFSKIEEYYKTVNIYKFSLQFLKSHYFPFLEAYCKSIGHDEYYEDVLRVIAFVEKSRLTAMPLMPDQRWYEIDDINDLEIAEVIFSQKKDKLKKLHSRFGGYWRFPKILDFCYLVNPFFPPLKMREELISNFGVLMEQYPSGQEVNRQLAAKIFNIDPRFVVVGNGASELINALCSFDSHLSTGIAFPTFEEYSNRIDDSKLIELYTIENDFCYSCDDLINLSNSVDQLILINPDNPSGHFIKKEEVLGLLEYLKLKNKVLIFDESFIDFADKEVRYTLIDQAILEKYPNLIVVKSISKSYGVPGFRLGIVITSNVSWINKIKTKISIWNINSYGEYFMQIFNKYSKEYIEACDKLEQSRNSFHLKLQNVKHLRVLPSQANYFLCEVLPPFDSTEVSETLLSSYNIIIKDCKTKKGFKNMNYIRIAIRTEQENDYLVKSLLDILN